MIPTIIAAMCALPSAAASIPRKRRYRRLRLIVLATMALVGIGFAARVVFSKAIRVVDDTAPATPDAVRLERLTRALELFRKDCNRYPTDLEGLNALLKDPGTAAGWSGPYIADKTVPRDQNGLYFMYHSKPQGEANYTLRAPGPDGYFFTRDDLVRP